MRESRAPVILAPDSWFRMVRSFSIVNSRPRYPTRRARKNTGPGSDSLMPMAAMARTGDVNTSATVAQQTSKRRFTMLQRPANGHEDFRGLEALLVAPGERPVAQRVEGARMRIGTELA